MPAARIDVDADGLGKLERRINKTKRDLQRKPRRSAERGVDRMVFDMKENVVEKDAVASTELFRGIRSFKTDPRGALRSGASFKGSSGWKIVSDAPHSALVEFGTGDFHVQNPWTETFQAPKFSEGLVGAIFGWMQIKPSFTPRGHPESLEEWEHPWAIARRIAISISRDRGDPPSGTKPKPFFVPVAEDASIYIVPRVEVAVKHSV